MNKIFGIFFILGVFGNSTFCQSYYPLPYKNQNEDYARKLFDIFFTNVVPNEARNDSLTAPAPPTTPKLKPTTETAAFYPVYQETIYEPSYYPIIPPYPVFYNAPLDSSQLQVDNLAPYFPVVNNIPSIYSNGIHPVPFLNPALSNANGGEIGTEVQKALNEEMEKLLREFYAKHLPHIKGQDNIESSTKTNIELPAETDIVTSDSVEEDEYKVIEPRITVVPEVSADPVQNHVPSVTEKIIVALKPNKTNELDSVNGGKINQSVESNGKVLVNEVVSNSSRPTSHENSEIAKTTPSYTEINQISVETAPQNETDDSRKLDFNNQEFTTDTTTDKSQPITMKNLSALLGNNQTSVGSELIDHFTELLGKPVNLNLLSRTFFLNSKGNTCKQEVVISDENKRYNLYTCEEQSYGGKSQHEGRTRKSNVTYFTEELLSTEQSTTELTPQHQSMVTDDLPNVLDK